MGRFLLRSLIANGMVSLSEPAAPPPPQRRRLLLERLEDRLLFDAGPVAPIDADAELADAQASQEALSQAASLAEPADVRVFGSLDQVEAVVADLPGASSVSEFLPGAETPVAVDGSTTSVLTAEPTGTSLDSDELAEQLLTTADELRSERHEATSGVREELLTGQPVSRSEVVTRREIAFVDTSLVGHEQLVTDLLAQHDPSREMQIVLVDARDKALAKITDTLRQASDIDAIHILSHGDSRGFRLGSQWVTSDLLAGFSAEVTSWGDALLDGADILIYGCDLASATAGRELLQSLAALTGADVAASDDVTGSSAQGGDWDLEFRIGDVSTASALSDGGAFEGTLVTVNVGNGALVGALGRGLYSIDVTTAKATLLATAPATIGGVAVSSTINSVASNPIDGLIYFVDNESATANEELFAYDFINNTFLLLDDNLTDNGVVVGSRGVGSGSGYYSTTNQTLYLGVERSTSTTDVLFAITFTAGSNGRTVDGVTVEQTVTLSGAFSSHDWGDILVDVANNRWIDLDSGSTTSRTFNLATDALISATNHGFSGTQGGTDHNGNSYIVSSSLRTYDPDTNTLGSSSVTITTNGSTGWGSAADAAGLVPKTAQVGNLIFNDQNADGTFNGTDSGIGNVTVTIHDDVDGDGVIDAVDRLLGTDTSAANGSYEFAGLLPGQYIITITDANGVLTGASSTTSGGLTQMVTINLIGQSILTTDFGFDLNDAPTTADSSVTTNEDTSRTFAASDFPFSDADGDTLQSVTISSLPAEGLLKLNGTNVTAGQVIPVANINAGQLVFTPDSNESNTPYATFTFSVSDGSLSSSAATMTVHVTPVNDAPAGTNGSRTIDEDATYLFAASDFGFSDPVDSPAHTFLEVVINTLPASGTLRLSGTPLTGGQVIPVGQIGNLTYSPPAQAFGSPLTSFTFSVRDNGGTANGGQNTDLSPNTFTFHVNPQNDPPVADDETFTVPEDGSVVIDVLNGDTDVDGDTLTVTEIDGSPISVGNPVTIATGVVSLNGDGTLTFAPNENFHGAAAFDYTVSDGNGGTDVGHVSGNVTPVNDAPVGGDNSRTTLEDTDYVFEVVDFPFSDVDGDLLAEVRIDSLPTDGTLLLNSVAVSTSDIITVADITSGKLIFRPDSTENGSPYATFDFSVGDGTDFVASPSTMTMHVTPVGFPPVADDETFVVPEDGSVIIDVLDGDTDLDGDTLTVTEIDGSPISLGNPVTIATGVVSLNVDGTLTFTPNADYNGPAAFDYTVNDGNGGTDIGNVPGDVTPQNDPPVADDETFVVPEDGSVIIDVLDGDTDIDGDTLVVTEIDGLPISLGNPITIATGVVSLNVDGTLTFTPNADFNGPASFDYTVSDGALTDIGNVSGDVTPQNDPPVADDETFVVPEDGSVIIDVLDGDTDIDGDSLTVTEIDGSPISLGNPVTIATGVVSLNADGTLTFTPNADFNGPAAFDYTVSDGLATDVGNVSSDVTPVDDLPSGGDYSVTMPEETDYVFATSEFPYSDVDGDALTRVRIDSLPTDGTLLLYGNPIGAGDLIPLVDIAVGGLSFRPDVDESGSPYTTFAFSVGNATAFVATSSTMTVHVTPTTVSVVKSLFDSSDPSTIGSNVTIGEELCFALLVTLSEGNSTDLIVTDLLPDGLQYGSWTLLSEAASSNGLLTADFNGSVPAPSVAGGTSDGEDVSFTFGAISVASDGDAANNSFVLLVHAFVSDIPNNHNPLASTPVLSNTASADVSNALPPSPSNPVEVTVVEPDLSVTIGNGVETLTAGQTTTYSITITNDGDLSATGVTLSGSLPVDRIAFVSSDDAANFSIDGSGSFVWTPAVSSLAPGDSLTLLLTTQVGSSLASGITEVTIPVSVTHNNIEPTPANNSAEDNDTLDAAPDLRLSKTDYTNSVSPGPCTSYTINVGNFGSQEATNVVVTETIPDGSTFNPALSDPGWTSVGGNVYEYSIASLPAGASFNINLSVFIDSPAVAGREVIVNTVTIADDGTNGPDLDPTDNAATDTDSLDALPMYDIGIDDLQLSAVPGESLTYYVNFNNYGLQNGTGVVITVSYPTALLTNVVPSDGGIVDALAGTITWNVGDLAANDPRTFEIAADVREVIPAGTDDVTLTAAITDDGSNGPDPDLSDNSSSDTDTLVAQPDYQITIDDSETTVRPGDPLTHTIGVANQGQQDGTGVVVSVSFPTSLLENVIASQGGVVDAVAGTITWNLGDLDAGDSATLTVTTQVRNAISTQASSLTLTATITDDGLNGADPTPQNNLDDDLDRLQVYAYDSFHDWKDLRSAFLAPQQFVVGRPLAPLPVDPVFSGLTEPGSTLVARIYDADGRQLGDRQVVADTGGNWLVTFPNIVIYEQPHRMEIIVTPAINNAVHENGFNLRRYFHPAVHSGLVMTESLSVAGVFRNRAYNIIEAQHSANTHPLGFHWFSHAYELNAASTNVAQM